MLAFRFSGQGLNLLARGGDQSRRRADLAEADANQSPKNGCDCAAWQNKCSCGTRKDRPGRKRYCDTRLEGTRHDLPDPDRERTEHKQDHDNYRPRYAANDTTVPGFRDVADETLESIPMSETCAVSDHSTTGLDARQITPLDFGGSVRHRRGTSLAAHGSGSVVWGGPSWGLSPHSEPYRVCRRAFSLRGWSHVTTESVFPRSTRATRAGLSTRPWAAIESIAGKLGCTAETLRKWVRQAERDTGLRGGLTKDGARGA